MDPLLSIYNNTVIPFVTDQQNRKTKLPVSSAAVALIVGLYILYDRIACPPRKLRHIPYAGFLTYVKALLQEKTVDEIVQGDSLPILEKSKSGVYVRFDNFGWSVHVAGPEGAKKLLLKTDLFVKSEQRLHDRQGTLTGRFAFRDNNILTTTGQRWKTQRMVVNPAFRRAMPVQLFGRLSARVLDMVDRQIEADEEQAVDFHDMTQRFALDVIGLAGFGFDFHAIDDPENVWNTGYSRFTVAFRKPLFSLLPSLDRPPLVNLFPHRRQAHQDMTKFLVMMKTIIINKKRQMDAGPCENPAAAEKDLLTLMIEASMENQESMSDEELESNLCVFFLAGHDTTAGALAYAACLLATHPEIQDKARKEAVEVLGDAPEHILPTTEQARSIPYINMIIKETMRMNPPVATLFPRVAAQDTELNGVFIPKGTQITLQVHELHHNPAIWNDPETFNPDRFAPGGEADQLSAQGLPWVPFGNGSRQCIGMNFSLDEQRTMLLMLLRKYELSLPADSIHKENIITEGFALVKPKDMRIVFKRRY